MSDPEIAPSTDASASRFDADWLELIPDATLILDADARILALNAAAESLLGRSRAAACGQALRELLPADDALFEAIQRAFAGQPTAPFALSLTPERVLEARLRRSGGRLLLGLRDSSALRRAEAALHESEARFHQITGNLREVFWLSDAETRQVIYVSPAYLTLFGTTRESVYANSRTFLSAVHPDDRSRVREFLSDRDTPQRRLEYRIVRPDGAVRWVATESFRIQDEAGVVVRSGGVGEDITEHKQFERERARRLDQLQALANAALNINSAVGVHEALNTVTASARAIIGAHQSVASLRGRNNQQFIDAFALSEKYSAWAGYNAEPTGAGIYSAVLEEKRVFRLTQAELEAHPRWRSFSGERDRHPPMRGWLAAPIIGSDGEPAGILQLSDKYEGDFDEEDQAILLQLAQLASTALERARLFESERSARLIADTLQSANSAITQALELEPILELLLDYLGRLVPYDGANVMLLEADGKFHGRAMRGYAAWGIDASARQWVLDPNEAPLIGRLVKTRQAVKIDDTRLSPDWYAHPDTPQVRSWLGVPLIVEDAIIGLYSLDSAEPDGFTDAHRDVAQALAAPAAFAIQRALLFDQVLHYAAELEQRVEERTHELVEANQRLEALNQSKARFVSDVSHELRNPIASLNLSFELMKRRTSAQIIERLPDMQEQMDLLLALTNSILDISRLDLTRGAPLTFMSVDLNELLTRVTDLYRSTAENAGLQLRYTANPDLPPVRGEQSQLTQVATNLVSNAIKYTPAGHVDVRTSFDRHTGYASLIVEDTGLGINDEDMPHLFERFYRGSEVRESTIPGTGLGLPIVYDIVQLHAGSISAESEVGKGSRFTVLLPLA